MTSIDKLIRLQISLYINLSLSLFILLRWRIWYCLL